MEARSVMEFCFGDIVLRAVRWRTTDDVMEWSDCRYFLTGEEVLFIYWYYQHIHEHRHSVHRAA